MTMTPTPTCCCWRVPHAATARGRTGPATTREAKPQELDFSSPPPLVSDWWTRMVGRSCPKWSLLPSCREGTSVPSSPAVPEPRGAMAGPCRHLCVPRWVLHYGGIVDPARVAASTRLWGKKQQKRGSVLCRTWGWSRSWEGHEAARRWDRVPLSPLRAAGLPGKHSGLPACPPSPSPSWWGAAGPSSADRAQPC